MPWFAALALCLSLVAVFLSLRGLRDESPHGALQPEALRRLARTVRGKEDAEQWLTAARAAGEEELLKALLGAETPDVADALLRERLLEVRHSTRSRLAGSRSAARAALASGGLCALLRLSTTLGQPSIGPKIEALVALSFGAFGSIVCVQVGRLADRRSQKVRASWEELSRSLRERALVTSVHALGGGATGARQPKAFLR